MRIRNLPILLFIVLIVIAGCKKNTVKPPAPPPTPPCSGPELLVENILPDYLKNADGNGNNINDEIASDPSGNVYIENTSQQFSIFGSPGNIAGISQGYLYKFDAFGKQVYLKPAITGYESVMAVDSMQNVYIGYSTILGLPWHCIVNAGKYNNAGDSLWSKHIYYDSDAYFNCLGVSNNGVLHVAALDISSAVDSQYNDATAQVEPGSGNMMYTFDQASTLTQVKQVLPYPEYFYQPLSYQFFPSGDFYAISYGNNAATINKFDINSKLVNTFSFPVPVYSSVYFDSKFNAYSIDSTTVTKYTTGFTQAWSIKTQKFKSIKTDADGNVYIAGTFSGTVNFNPSGTAKTLTAKGNNDSFIEKFDADGKMVWVIQSLGTDGKTYTGASQIDKFLVTSKNEIFVTGSALNSGTNTNIHFGALYTQCN